MNIETIEKELLPLRNQLKNHELYTELSSLKDVQLFMESHVYAVWDFMSLLKALQINLTTTTLPWKPKTNSAAARFINEIVLEEESDVNVNGLPQSHFEMYLEAMVEAGADVQRIQMLLTDFKDLDNFETTLEVANLLPAERDFLKFTFSVIQTQEPHIIAAAFTFGREDVIPDMFLKIIEGAETQDSSFPKLGYYLKRHIELDGDDHGPLALKMIQELCGDDHFKWNEVAVYSKKALEKRILLWDSIAERIKHKKTGLVEA